MPAISENQRVRLLRISAVTCASAILLLPMAAQSSAPILSIGVPVEAVAVPTVAPRLPRAAASAGVRDPFVPIVAPDGAETPVAPVLLAFASGVRPVALVEVDGRTVALSVGAMAFGARVTYLDPHTVHLSDGRTFALRRPS